MNDLCNLRWKLSGSAKLASQVLGLIHLDELGLNIDPVDKVNIDHKDGLPPDEGLVVEDHIKFIHLMGMSGLLDPVIEETGNDSVLVFSAIKSWISTNLLKCSWSLSLGPPTFH